MKHSNAIDPLIRRHQELHVKPPTDFDAIIADQRIRQANSDALDGVALDNKFGLAFKEVIGVSKQEGTDLPHYPTHIVEEDPNTIATRLSEAAWNGLSTTKDSPEFRAFAARLRNPASLALDNVTHVDFVHQDTNRAVEQNQDVTEIAS